MAFRLAEIESTPPPAMSHQNLAVSRESNGSGVKRSERTPSPDDGVTPRVDMAVTARDGFFPYNEEKTMQSV